jgi:hypothetical protein
MESMMQNHSKLLLRTITSLSIQLCLFPSLDCQELLDEMELAVRNNVAGWV